jgi:hypothetical protein
VCFFRGDLQLVLKKCGEKNKVFPYESCEHWAFLLIGTNLYWLLAYDWLKTTVNNCDVMAWGKSQPWSALFLVRADGEKLAKIGRKYALCL